MGKYLNLCAIFMCVDFDCSANGECDNRENVSKIYAEYHRNIGRHLTLDDIGDTFQCHTAAFFEAPKYYAFYCVCAFDL